MYMKWQLFLSKTIDVWCLTCVCSFVIQPWGKARWQLVYVNIPAKHILTLVSISTPMCCNWHWYSCNRLLFHQQLETVYISLSTKMLQFAALNGTTYVTLHTFVADFVSFMSMHWSFAQSAATCIYMKSNHTIIFTETYFLLW